MVIQETEIRSQPQNQTNVVGTTATFTVEATGAEPVAYQWQHAHDLSIYQGSSSDTPLYDKLTRDPIWFQVNGTVHLDTGGPGRSVRIEPSRDLLNWKCAGEASIPASKP